MSQGQKSNDMTSEAARYQRADGACGAHIGPCCPCSASPRMERLHCSTPAS